MLILTGRLKSSGVVAVCALALAGCVETVSTTEIYEPVRPAPRASQIIIEEEYEVAPRHYYGGGYPYRRSYYGSYESAAEYRRQVLRAQARENLEAQKNAIRNEREYQKRLFRRQRDLGLL